MIILPDFLNPFSECKDFIMKKLFIPIICSSVVLLAASSVSAKPELLKTVDVLCAPTARGHNTMIKDSRGNILFNSQTLAAAIESRGGEQACRHANAKGNFYIFTAGTKEDVNNPLGDTKEKIVFSISLKPIGGDAYRGHKPVLSGNVSPRFEPRARPTDYHAIVETRQKVIKDVQVQRETSYTHIIRR
jgi:hypothetical protein